MEADNGNHLQGRKRTLKVGFGVAAISEWNRTIFFRAFCKIPESGDVNRGAARRILQKTLFSLRQDQEGSRTSRFSATIRLMLRTQARSRG